MRAFTVLSGLVFHLNYFIAVGRWCSFDDVKVVRRGGGKQRVKHSNSFGEIPVSKSSFSFTAVVFYLIVALKPFTGKAYSGFLLQMFCVLGLFFLTKCEMKILLLRKSSGFF